MNTKTIIAGIIAGVVSFLLGWLIFGTLLHDFYNEYTQHYDGLNKVQPTMWALGIANLSWGLLLAYVLNRAGANSIAKGFTMGFITFLLSLLGYNMLMVALMHLITIRLALVDTAINAVLGGILGAIIGWYYSLGNKSAS